MKLGQFFLGLFAAARAARLQRNSGAEHHPDHHWECEKIGKPVSKVKCLAVPNSEDWVDDPEVVHFCDSIEFH